LIYGSHDGLDQAGGCHQRHPMRFCHRTSEILSQSKGTPEQSYIGGEHSEQRSDPAQLGTQGYSANRVTCANQDHDIGDTIGKVVKYISRRSFQSSFDRYHPVEHVAEQAKLDESGRRYQQHYAQSQAAPGLKQQAGTRYSRAENTQE